MTDSSRRAKLILCFAAVYLIWGSTYLVASIGVHVMPPILFGGIRFICAGILLGITALALGKRFPLDATEWRHLLIVAVGSVLIPNGFTNWAMQTVASNQTAILNVSAALWIALFATQGRRAHALDKRTVIGLVIGFGGALLIVWPRGSLDTGHFGMQLLILVAVFVWSATTVYIRNVHSKLDLLAFSAMQMLLGGLMMTGVGLGLGEAAQWHWSAKGLTAMAYLTVASSCVAYTAFSWLARNTTPALVGTYSYVNPAIAAVLGWWFLKETLGANQLIGMAIMFAGVALVSWPQNDDKQDAKRLDEDQQRDPSTAGCG
ncbi:MAG TPA: EamA family transporter [Steroidobacteraceae bacterium]|jgi:drug/metabolite transporter (DMT)-like permease|nr:EamA family transporter [Steroidobacteraceae bacterium]